MGLAATGTFNSSLHKLLSPMIQIKGLRIVASPDYFYRLTTVLQIPPELRPDLAHTGQRIFEEKVITLLNNAHHAYPHTNLIYSGGCALNSSCNGKILGKTPFTRLHIPMAPADDGNALGAALLAWKDHYPLERPPRIQSPYMGSIIDGVTLDRAVAFGGHATRRHASDEALCEEVAQRLANGHLVGWVQGRAEFGPRALGNRSILADPRCERVKDKINGVVKFRESFRPFAPAILHEYGPSYFKNYQYSPFMERTLLFSDSDSAPGVVHDDGTGRLQSVTKENNPLFYALLLEFYKITGLPMLLNTSFNVMGRPIMHDVEDALSVFYTSGLDTLVIDSNVFDKRYHNADEGI
jgi:carbamoyltransferase